MKILYCVAGSWHCGVLESEILGRSKLESELSKRSGMSISAKRAFSLEPDQSKVVVRGGQGQIGFSLVTYNNVMMNCSFISDLPEQSVFYKEIAEFVEKEASREN